MFLVSLNILNNNLETKTETSFGNNKREKSAINYCLKVEKN